MEHDRQNFLSFWAIFLPLYATNNPKNENFEKMKKKNLGDIIILTSVPKIMIICNTIPEIWHVTDVIFFFILNYFLPFYPLTARQIKILKKMKKALGDIIILHTCTKNYDHMMYNF